MRYRSLLENKTYLDSGLNFRNNSYYIPSVAPFTQNSLLASIHRFGHL